MPSVHHDWLQDAANKQERSKEDFVQHYRQRHGGHLPVWVVTEILDFGGLSYLYSGLLRLDRAEIGLQLGIVNTAGLGNEAALMNWMRTVNCVRNVCAHIHSRLWNRNMDEKIAPKDLFTIPELAHKSAASTTTPSNTSCLRHHPGLRRACGSGIPHRAQLPRPGVENFPDRRVDH